MPIQRSFAFGEASPTLLGGADPRHYASALATCRNFIVLRGGGAANRSGTQFVAEVKDSSVRTYLMKFEFSADDNYILEIGQNYFRFFREGAQVTVGTPAAWSAIVNYVVGDVVVNAGVNYYCVADHINQAPPNASFWYALIDDILEIPTPYAAADAPLFNYVQNGDIVTIVHPVYQPRELRRYLNRWTLTPINTVPSQDQPDSGVGTAGAAGALVYRYRVTAVNARDFEESLPGNALGVAITGATQANPVVVTTGAAHGFNNGDEVWIKDVEGMIQINDRAFIIDNVTANTFELVGIDGTGYGAWTANGSAARTWIEITSAAPAAATPNVISWAPAPNALEYNVYLDLASNKKFGFVGTTTTTTFNDIGYEPDMSDTHPLRQIKFTVSGEFPRAVGLHHQRRFFGGSLNEPEVLEGSVTGFPNNFSTRSPIQDDDAVRFRLMSAKVSEIRHLLEIGSSFVVLTSTGEWVRPGVEPVAPTAPNFDQQAYWGASTVRPVVAGTTLIYTQARGGIVRDLKFANETGYEGRDLSLFSSHLFEGRAIERFDWAQMPNSIVWAVRDDGRLLGMTYLREFDVWGWHRHDTEEGAAAFEDVCTIPETRAPVPGSSIRGKEEDAVYVIVRRTIGGNTKRYIERFASRQFEDYRLDAIFMDSSLSYNGVNAAATTVTLSTFTGDWLPTDTITVTASANAFTAGDVGNGITVWQPGTTNITRIMITSFVSATVVRGNPIAIVPVPLRSVATLAWSRAVDQVAGLDHLEGKEVVVLANGVVITGLTVTGGTINLSAVYDLIHVGLPITADLETLDLDTGADGIREKNKKLAGGCFLVQRSRGVLAGPDFDTLSAFVPDTGTPLATDLFSPAGSTLFTEPIEVYFSSTIEKKARICIRQTEPLPLTVLGVIPLGEIGGG